MTLSGLERRYLSVVRILRNGDYAPIGTGFIVDPNHIMTCAHVVGDALGLDEEGSDSIGRAANPPEEEVNINFLAVQQGAVPHRAKPVRAGWRPRGGQAPDDIAVLELVGPDPIPRECQPVLACRKITEEKIIAYGVKQGLPEGTYLEGNITGYLGPGRIEIFSKHQDQAVDKGCSGGAAWSLSRGGIVGMIVEMHTSTQGLFVPMEKLLEVWPTIELKPESGGQFVDPQSLIATTGRRLSNLLYTFDRESQETGFDEALDLHWDKSRRPAVTVIAGIQDDRPELCRDRCQRVKLRERLERIELGGKNPNLRRIPWPERTGLKVASEIAKLTQHPKSALIARDSSAAEVRRAYNSAGAPWVFFCPIKRPFFDQSHRDLLTAWIGFWREVGSEPLNKPLAVFLLLNLDGQSPSGFCLERFFEDELLPSPPDGALALPRLNSFDLQQVTDWLNEKALELGVTEDDLSLRLRPAIVDFLRKKRTALRLSLLERCLDTLRI